MSEEIWMRVGESLEKSRNAVDRAEEAHGTARTALNAIALHETRITDIEEEQDMQRTATERLSRSVDRLEQKLPPAKTVSQATKELWIGSSNKARGSMVALITAIAAPGVIEFLKAVGTLVDRIGALLIR